MFSEINKRTALLFGTLEYKLNSQGLHQMYLEISEKVVFSYNGTLHSLEFTLQATIGVNYPIQFSMRNKPQHIRIFMLFPRSAIVF